MTAEQSARHISVLATQEQYEAERTLLALLADSEVKAELAKLKAELEATAAGKTSSGLKSLDSAVTKLANSLIFKEIATYRTTPALIWGTEDTPHEWLGHTIAGAGTAGDNPDNVYRMAVVHGACRYEIVGQFDIARRPAQLSLEVVSGESGLPPDLKSMNSHQSDMGNQIRMITDRDLAISPDGKFRITIGGAADGPNHVDLAPGVATACFRDSLSDWMQRPVQLAIRQVGDANSMPFDPTELRRRVLARLPGFVIAWGTFAGVWFGGLEPSTISGPVTRDGGWGYVAGLRYKLAPDEALAVTIARGDAIYTGFQLTDPWMIAGDASRYLTSLNTAQTAPDADGSLTYVISRNDPGVANWLDTNGLDEGYGVIRWQGLPSGRGGEQLLRAFTVIKRADAVGLPGIPLISPEQRRAQLATRQFEWNNRVR